MSLDQFCISVTHQEFTRGQHNSFGVPFERTDGAMKDKDKESGKKQPVSVDFLDKHAAQKWEVGSTYYLITSPLMAHSSRLFCISWSHPDQRAVHDHRKAFYTCLEKVDLWLLCKSATHSHISPLYHIKLVHRVPRT